MIQHVDPRERIIEQLSECPLTRLGTLAGGLVALVHVQQLARPQAHSVLACPS